MARGQVCVLKDLAEGQVLKSLCLWGLAEGQVCALRTWPKAKSVSGPSLCKCRVQQCHFCAPPPQGNSSRLGVPLTPRSQFCVPPPRGTSLVVHSKAMQMPWRPTKTKCQVCASLSLSKSVSGGLGRRPSLVLRTWPKAKFAKSLSLCKSESVKVCGQRTACKCRSGQVWSGLCVTLAQKAHLSSH